MIRKNLMKIKRMIVAASVVIMPMSILVGCSKDSQTAPNNQGNNIATTQAVTEGTSTAQEKTEAVEHASVAVNDAEDNTIIVDGIVASDGTSKVYNMPAESDNQTDGAAYTVSTDMGQVADNSGDDNNQPSDTGAPASDNTNAGSSNGDVAANTSDNPTPAPAPTPDPTPMPEPAPAQAPYELTTTEAFLRQVGASNRDSDTAVNVYTKLCAIGDGLVSGSYSEAQANTLISQIKDDTNGEWSIYQTHAKIFTESGKYECNSTPEKQALSAAIGNNVGNFRDDNKYMRVFYNPNTDSTTFYYVGVSGTAVHN